LRQFAPASAPDLSHALPTDLRTTVPDDLGEVVRGWGDLTSTVRAEIVARVRFALGQGDGR